MNKKKILKGLGVGALACVAMVGLTGCANISNSDYDRIMETVETVENTVSDKEAAIVYNNAMNKIINTSSDFWTNMKVQSTMSYFEEGEEITTEAVFYMLKVGEENISMLKFVGETDTIENNQYETIYTQGETVYFINKEVDGFYKSEKSTTFVDECLNGIGGWFNCLFIGTSTENGFMFNDHSDIVSAEKNEKGNYIITTIIRDVYTEFGHTGIESFVVENEIDENFNLISQTINVTMIDGDYSVTGKQTNIYTYGTLEYSDIQEEFEALQNYQE